MSVKTVFYIALLVVFCAIPSAVWYGVISLIQYVVSESGGNSDWMQTPKYWISAIIYVVVLAAAMINLTMVVKTSLMKKGWSIK